MSGYNRGLLILNFWKMYSNTMFFDVDVYTFCAELHNHIEDLCLSWEDIVPLSHEEIERCVDIRDFYEKCIDKAQKMCGRKWWNLWWKEPELATLWTQHGSIFGIMNIEEVRLLLHGNNVGAGKVVALSKIDPHVRITMEPLSQFGWATYKFHDLGNGDVKRKKVKVGKLLFLGKYSILPNFQDEFIFFFLDDDPDLRS